MVARAIAEALPFADESFDFVWIRDVLVHIESLRPAFAEVRRVLRPEPRSSCSTSSRHRCSNREAERLWSATAVMPTSADPEVFRRAVADADLEIERWEELRASGGSTSRRLATARRHDSCFGSLACFAIPSATSR